MAVVDTIVLVALFDRDHPHHARAVSVGAAHSTWNVPGGVLGEFTWIIRRSALDSGADGDAAARRALVALEEMVAYRATSDYDTGLALRIYHTQPRLSYVDACCVALAYMRDEPLLTFDDDQARALARLR